MNYRKATVWDAMKVTSLWDKMHKETDKTNSIKKEHANLKNVFLNITARCELPQWNIFIAEEGTEMIGFIMGFLKFPEYDNCHKIVFCEAVYVEPEFRHQGIHEILIRMGADWGIENGATQFEFIGGYNLGYIKFWEKLGYEPVSITYRKKEGDDGTKQK